MYFVTHMSVKKFDFLVLYICGRKSTFTAGKCGRQWNFIYTFTAAIECAMIVVKKKLIFCRVISLILFVSYDPPSQK